MLTNLSQKNLKVNYFEKFPEKGYIIFMKKTLIFLVFSVVLSGVCGFPAFAEDSAENYPDFYYTCFVKKHLSEDANQLNVFLAKYFQAHKDKNLAALKELYADEYMSGDNINRENIIKLVRESWDLTDNLEYSSEIQNIRFDSNFAAVEINENLIGVTKSKSDITNDNGLVESSVRTILYLKKYGNGWKINTDKTLYEESSIKYGKAKDLNIDIYAPEQVFENNNYSVSIKTEIPADTFALGSITTEKLTFPREKTEEVFRQVPSDINMLERMVKANNNDSNELAVGSISFCAVKKGSFTLPEIDVSGTAVLLKRVNVE